MLKTSILLVVILSSLILDFSHNSQIVLADQPNLIEELNIYHIYNETIFSLNLTYYNNTDILKLGNYLSHINNYTIIIFNLNQTERLLRWFLSPLNPISTFDFLIEKGIVLKIYYDSISNINTNYLIYKANIALKTKFLALNVTNNFILLVSGGNYTNLISNTLKLINYKYKGLYELFSSSSPEALIYQYNSQGLRKLILIKTSTFTTTPQIKTEKTFQIDYTQYLGNLTKSEMSSKSELNFYLFGLNVINSTLQINWNTGYDKHWITQGKYILNSSQKIGKVVITASKLDPFIIIFQRMSPGVFNSTSKMIVSVFNIGAFNVKQVKVKLNLPNWLSSTNDTLVFNNVTFSMQSKSLNVTVIGQLSPGVYEIPAPVAYYSYGSTNFTTIGNTIQVGYKVKHFASLSFYIRPSSSQWPDLFSSLTDLYIVVLNTGNVNATNVHIKIDYFDTVMSNVTANGNVTFPISMQPLSFNNLPVGADVFYNATITYTNSSQTYSIKIPASSLATIGSLYSYVNYLSTNLIPSINEAQLNRTVFKWLANILGTARSVIFWTKKSYLNSQGLIHSGTDSFSEVSDTIQTSYSSIRGSSVYISISLNITKHDSFVIPFFENVTPIKKIILQSPLVFSSALILEKSTNSTLIKINQTLAIKVTITNKGSSPLFDVYAQDILAEGWKLTSGAKSVYKEILFPNESITIEYSALPISPKSPNIGQTNAQFNVFGIKFNSTIASYELKIFIQVLLDINKWNGLKLSSGSLLLYDSKGNLVANITIADGKAMWPGYIGNFTAKVIYQGVNVLTQQIVVTSSNTTFSLRTYIFDLRIKLTDLLGLPIKNADVKVIGNLTQVLSYSDGFYTLNNIPKGMYLLVIKVGSYEYKVPIVIDESTNTKIEIPLSIIDIEGFTIDFSLIIGVLIILFIALFAYYYLRKPSSST
jgi:uncharacterized repeat protein (TIGR01451 family)